MKHNLPNISDQKGFAPLLVVALILVIAAVGFAGWAVYAKQTTSNTKQKEQSGTIVQPKETVKKDATVLKRECPDEWIENRMPATAGNKNTAQYFIIGGQRKEITDYDVDWIKSNCSVKIQYVE